MLEFIFAASELVEAGWDVEKWAKQGSCGSHPFGELRQHYRIWLSESPAGTSRSPTRGRVKLPHLTASGRGMITRFDAPWQGVPRIP
jgi:hypothetical protein